MAKKSLEKTPRRRKLEEKAWKRAKETERKDDSPLAPGGSGIFRTVHRRYNESFEKLCNLLPKDKAPVIHMWGIGRDFFADGDLNCPVQTVELMQMLKDRDYTLHVMDFFPRFVDMAKKYLNTRKEIKHWQEYFGKDKKVFFHAVDMGDADCLPRDQPDVLIATNVHMYIKKEEIESALMSTIGALKPNGLILIDAKDAHTIKRHLGMEVNTTWPYRDDIELEALGLEHLDTSGGYSAIDHGIIYRKTGKVPLSELLEKIKKNHQNI